MTEQEKYEINRVIYSDSDTWKASQKRKSIAENGTPEERDLLAAWVKWDQGQKEMRKREDLLNQIGHGVVVILLFGALWAVVSIVRYMWNHPLFR